MWIIVTPLHTSHTPLAQEWLYVHLDYMYIYIYVKTIGYHDHSVVPFSRSNFSCSWFKLRVASVARLFAGYML